MHTMSVGSPRQVRQGRCDRPALRLPRLGGSLLRIAALLGITLLIVAAVWWRGYSAEKARQESFQTLMSQAESKRVLGQASVDRTEAMGYLKDAEALVGQALAIDPTAAAALALRDGVVRDTDVAKGITRMETSQVTPLYSFMAAGAGPGRVVGDGSNLYVLDKGDQKVYKFVLNAQGNGVQQDSVLVRKGDQVGGKVVADLLDIAWIPVGGNRKAANLVILDSAGNLLQYDATKGLSVLPVKDAASWRRVQATGGYAGNFYILDNLANNILRYRATTRGYDDASSSYLLGKVELASAIDMAIDGDVFVLMVNGQIVWLSKGQPQTGQVEGLDRPMSAPVAIFTNEGSQSLYVADPSNSRVVKLSKQLVVQKQFVYQDQESSFQRLRGVFADENRLSLYVTAGTKIFHIVLPK